MILVRTPIRSTGLFLAAVLMAAAAGHAEVRVSPTSGPATLTRVAAAARGAAVIFGYVWTADTTPVPNAALRLRNVVSGRVEATTVSGADGEFTFADVEGGKYVIECFDDRGRLIATGQTFTLAPGETIATFVRLAAGPRLFSGMFDNAAAAVVSSAAGLGVTAVAPTGQPVTRNR